MTSKKPDSTISEVSRQGGRSKHLGPIIVDLGHGKINPDVVSSFEVQKVSYDFKSSNPRDEVPIGASPSLNVELKLDELVYSSEAPSVKQINSNEPYQKTFLAIRNKTTNKIRLIEANSITLGAIVKPPPSTNPILIEEEMKRGDNDIESNKATTGPESEKKKAENRLAMNKNLVREFGQKKGKRIYEQNDRMQINPDLLDDKLSRAAMTVEKSSLEQKDTPEENAPIAPPRNGEATIVEQVYTLENGILNSDEIIKLKAAATKLCEEYTTVEKIQHGAQTKYFSDIFAKILKKEYKEFDSDNLAIAIYMEAIINFINMKAREVAKGPKAMQQFVPIELRQKVFRMFTDEQKNIVPATRDSAVCYVIVLALMAHKYCVEFSDLSSSIRGKADQLKKLIRVTGARLITDVPTKTSCVVLKLPLDTYDPSVVVKGRKGRK